MAHLSRRRFLQLAGITVLGSAAGIVRAEAAYYGRSFEATPVYTLPDRNTSPVAQLWPDSVVTIRESVPGWYQTGSGYVERPQIQPLGETWPGTAQHSLPQPPFWAEVIAPVAPVYAHCALDAPLIQRIGHGGVMYIIDILPGQPDWYNISSAEGQHIGWSQAGRWRALDLALRPIARLELRLDQNERLLRIAAGGQALLHAAYASPGALLAGEYSLSRGLPGGAFDPTSGHYGAAWNLQVGDRDSLSGIYWHNRFGAAAPGSAIQLPPMLAKWLYERLPQQSTLRVYS